MGCLNTVDPGVPQDAERAECPDAVEHCPGKNCMGQGQGRKVINYSLVKVVDCSWGKLLCGDLGKAEPYLLGRVIVLSSESAPQGLKECILVWRALESWIVHMVKEAVLDDQNVVANSMQMLRRPAKSEQVM